MLDKFVEFGGVGEVGGDEPGLAALGGDGVDHRLAPGGIASVHDDLGAVQPERFGNRFADAGSGPGDQGTHPLEVSL